MEWGIKYVSFFAFSEENWGRPQEEVLGLMSLMMRSMKNELHSFLSNGIRFRVLGNLDRLSDELRSEIAHMEAATASGDKMTMIIFMSYSGKWDIRQAARRMAEEGGEDIEEYLVTVICSGSLPTRNLCLLPHFGLILERNSILMRCGSTLHGTDVSEKSNNSVYLRIYRKEKR